MGESDSQNPSARSWSMTGATRSMAPIRRAPALRGFLEARAPELMSRFIKDDMEWGRRAED